jgi:hypothetical protein
VTGVAREVGAPHQRPVDPGRGQFQPVFPFHRVLDVEHRRERARGRLAILDRHAAVGTFRHDLHGDAGFAENADPHQPVAETRQHRRRDGRDARGDPLLDDEPRFGEVFCGVRIDHARKCRLSGNKKERVPGGPLSNTDRTIRPL